MGNLSPRFRCGCFHPNACDLLGVWSADPGEQFVESRLLKEVSGFYQQGRRLAARCNQMFATDFSYYPE